ncbi:protein LYRIC isoform X4 [Ornithorhynchus anatinus]|uniref:protein LYRIC isoform X4 n=1 Tax=Ornithorhynchus anatinus TaxID=9258 RepID=UPI0010A84968|nr:protein LYRIC isoform X4 [Ornithorhynchus anatinus]
MAAAEAWWDWRAELPLQAQAGAARLRDLLSAGLGLLGLHVEPPPWAVAAGAAAAGLLLVLLLLPPPLGLLRARRGAPARRAPRHDPPAPAALLKALRGDDPKKKARKKGGDRPRPNGRPVLEANEVEVVQTTRKETLKQPLDAEKKNEKSKKNKKKSKADVKVAQDGSRHDGKEVDEGDPLLNAPNYKPGKGDSALQQGLNENPTVNGGGWNEKSVKTSSQISGGEEKWTSVSPASSGKRKNEPPVWNQDTGDTGANGKDWGVSLVGRTWSDRTIFPGIAAWSGVDRRMNTSEQNSASFTSLGLNPAVSGSSGEPVSQPTASDFQWDLSRNQPHVDDEWSGLNGLTSTDPSSDWNAPAEEWGNWVDEEKALHRKPQEPVPKVQKISDDKEKAEVTLQSSTDGKSKKKKKKKKQPGEDASSPAQDTEEVERNTRKNLQENTSKVKPPQEKPLKTKSTRDPAKTAETPPRAVSTEPSVILSVGSSDKVSSQVPQKQEKNVSNSNVKQNSVPPCTDQV